MLEKSRPSMWIAHDYPERPFGYGMWLCDCGGCLLALQADAVRRPDRAFVVKSNRDRHTITGVKLLVALQSESGAESLLDDSDDWIREVFVADGAAAPSRRRAA